jgi:hypothetical protein
MHNNGVCVYAYCTYNIHACTLPPPPAVAVKKIQSKKDIMLDFFAYLITSSIVFAKYSKKGAQ